MFTFDDIKMMYDWGCFTDEQVWSLSHFALQKKKRKKLSESR